MSARSEKCDYIYLCTAARLLGELTWTATPSFVNINIHSKNVFYNDVHPQYLLSFLPFEDYSMFQ